MQLHESLAKCIIRYIDQPSEIFHLHQPIQFLLDCQPKLPCTFYITTQHVTIKNCHNLPQ